MQKSKEEMLKLREEELEQLRKEREELEKRIKSAGDTREGGLLNIKNFTGKKSLAIFTNETLHT